MFERIRHLIVTVLSVALCLFTLCEVNFHWLQLQSAIAIFVMLGMVLCFLMFPLHKRLKDHLAAQCVDVLLAAATVFCCSYIVVQTEQRFEDLWFGGISLGNRAGAETSYDFLIGAVGLLLVLEVTRRSIGWIVPMLAVLFVLHSYYCHLSVRHGLPTLPGFMQPHAGQTLKEIASTTFLQDLGVFGIAAGVMFKYVFLFVVFGAFLEMSGATQYIIDFAERVFGRSPGGPAKVAVLGSGLMGSLSGSAVANAVTTGTFTIPMMRNAGFEPKIAAGITAAAATGGALVPPVMGAGAYMMLELVDPTPTFMQIARAALIPAVLYYLSLWTIVHFYSRKVGAAAAQAAPRSQRSVWQFEGLIFFSALTVLLGLLWLGSTPSRAVTGSLVLILLMSIVRRKSPLDSLARRLALAVFMLVVIAYQVWLAVNGKWTSETTLSQGFGLLQDSAIWGMLGLLVFGLIHPMWRPTILNAFTKSAKNGMSLVAAAACVGIIIGIVQQTGIASDFSADIKELVEVNLFVALLGIMCCSIVLGMGVPSVVCYLLMATLMGSLLRELGVIPLAAHLFIFYFGMMSMVTPPVALAAYASASIAKAKIMPTAMCAFRFSLVGFTLPFMFIYRPALLLLNGEKWDIWMAARPESSEAQEALNVAATALPPVGELLLAVVAAVTGIVALAAGIAGFFKSPLGKAERSLLCLAAALLLAPDVGGKTVGLVINLAGAVLFIAVAAVNWKAARRELGAADRA